MSKVSTLDEVFSCKNASHALPSETLPMPFCRSFVGLYYTPGPQFMVSQFSYRMRDLCLGSFLFLLMALLLIALNTFCPKFKIHSSQADHHVDGELSLGPYAAPSVLVSAH